MIQVEKLTKEFAPNKGIFDVSFTVQEGEIFGYLGPNGAGKSTTIRHLMGFMKADKGTVTVNGLNCWSQSATVQKHVGYLPGEIAFVDGMDGLGFIKLMEGMRSVKNKQRRNELINRLQFDVKTPIRKMSKGMKQKVAIVTAFMHDPEVLILDEPTSGLDPLMQKLFIDLILEEKERGKTILMSSHSFAEIERTSDRVGIIKDGRLVSVQDIHELRQQQRKTFEVTVRDEESLHHLLNAGLPVKEHRDYTVSLMVQGDYQSFLDVLSQCEVTNVSVQEQNLEELFMHYYDKKEASHL